MTEEPPALSRDNCLPSVVTTNVGDDDAPTRLRITIRKKCLLLELVPAHFTFGGLGRFLFWSLCCNRLF